MPAEFWHIFIYFTLVFFIFIIVCYFIVVIISLKHWFGINIRNSIAPAGYISTFIYIQTQIC